MQNPFCQCPEPTRCTCPSNWALCQRCGAAITWAKSGKARIPINGHVRVTEFSYTGHTVHLIPCIGRTISAPQPWPQARQRNFIADAEIAKLRQLRAKQQRNYKQGENHE